MRKIGVLLFIFAVVGLVYYVVTHFLFYRLSPKGVIPAIKSPEKDIRQMLPQARIYPGQISVAHNLVMDSFAETDGNLPRALAIDSLGHLLASSTNRGKILAFPDQDADGKADRVIEVITGLNKPHGITFYKNFLYVAETDKIVRYIYNPDTMEAGIAEEIVKLPGGGVHFTRTIRIHDDKLYISVGSSCNVCVEKDWRRASILVSDTDGNNLKVFAKGLRNTVFFTFDEEGRMWGADMGRDNLGDNLPPEEINLIEDGKDYGWPYCYSNQIRDYKFIPQDKATYCTNTKSPVYELPAHVAPLGIAFVNNTSFDNESRGNILLSLHGSWNSSVKVGYEIIELDFFAGTITQNTTFVGGFYSDNNLLGRPVDIVVGTRGEIYVSDDYAGLIYILDK